MPEHTSFLSYLLAMFPALAENMKNFGQSAFGKPVGGHEAEPIAASLLVTGIILALAFAAKGKIADHDKSVIPDDKLSLRTFWELFVGYFYNMMKDMMGPKRAKRFFPVIGTCACFIFFSNVLGLIPGFLPPTATLSVTAACGVFVLCSFTYYGFKEQGMGFVTHLFGPVWWLAPLFFVVEGISTFIIRPVTLAMRLMLNIAVDHLLLTIFLGMVAVLVPIPVMILGTLVSVVQVLVFCLLTSVYITLATEHHDEGHGHEEGDKSHA